MINCPNCGGLNGSGNPNCSFCGVPLLNNSVDPNFNSSIKTPDNTFIEPVYDGQDVGENSNQVVYDQNANQEVFYSPADDMSNDDMLVNAYIKKNVDKIKAGGFSIWAFLFGAIYVWYRKMYILLLIWFGMSLISEAIFSALELYYVSFVPVLIFNIFLGIKFKELYLKDVGVKVATIKSKNAEESPENLALICLKKGGTTIVPVILFGVVSLVILVLIILLIIPTLTGSEGDTTEKKETMVEEANLVIEAARTDMVTNEVKDNSKVYDITDLNEILESPLSISPFGKNYVYAKVQAVKIMDGSYIYKVCLIDEDRNGFGYTNEVNLSFESVLEGTAPDGC